MSFVDKIGGGKKQGGGSFVQRVGGQKSGNELGFADKLSLNETFAIYIYRGYDAQQQLFFVYLAVNYQLMERFRKRAGEGGEFDFAQYGAVLHRGYGTPSLDEMQYMEAQYGFKHENYTPAVNTITITQALFLYRCYDTKGRLEYFYVAVNEEKVEAFREIIRSQQPFYVADYAEILACGFGDPTPEIMQQMEEKHGFNHAEMFAKPGETQA